MYIDTVNTKSRQKFSENYFTVKVYGKLFHWKIFYYKNQLEIILLLIFMGNYYRY